MDPTAIASSASSSSLASGATTPNPTARDDIMKRITEQAASVRQTFESHSSNKRHIVSSATAAAAQHMANLNQRHKFENLLAMRAASSLRTFPTIGEQQQTMAMVPTMMAPTPTPDNEWNQLVCGECVSPPAVFPPFGNTCLPTIEQTMQFQNEPTLNYASAPRVSDGIVLKAFPLDITLNYNDVVCGSGKTTSSLVGNQRFNVWVSLHRAPFAKAFYDDNQAQQLQIARSLVDAVSSSVPAGRFISLDRETRLWYDVGYERAVGIALESLVPSEHKVGKIDHSHHEAAPALVSNMANVPRVYTPKAA
ncbi:hypothetical protein ACHAWU_006235 [Discostella pseudostelligera]|uniref:DUF6824 domain-containing protein n=1 Tax=Discostella pseudostelligera TaxID=259834 RepID=A0ABD3MM26_9STRA